MEHQAGAVIDRRVLGHPKCAPDAATCSSPSQLSEAAGGREELSLIRSQCERQLQRAILVVPHMSCQHCCKNTSLDESHPQCTPMAYSSHESLCETAPSLDPSDGGEIGVAYGAHIGDGVRDKCLRLTGSTDERNVE